MATTPPMYFGLLAVIALIAKYGMAYPWIKAIAIGLGGAGALAMFLMPRYKNLAVGSIALALLLWLVPIPASVSAGAPMTPEVAKASFNALASAVTSGLTISGNTIVVPETYNSTANTLDKDPYIVEFTVVRTDAGTEDASFTVSVSLPSKITDPATGLSYNVVELDSANKPKVYIIDMSDNSTLQDTKRVFQMPFGTTSKTIRVKIDLNPTAFNYAELYQSIAHSINVAGNNFNVVIQKVSEVE